MAKLKQKSQMSDRTREMLRMRKDGKSIREIAKILSCSYELVRQKFILYGDPLPKELRQK